MLSCFDALCVCVCVRACHIYHESQRLMCRRGHTPVNANLQGPHSPRSPCLAVSQEPPAQCKAAHSTSRALRGALRQCVGKLKSAMNYLDRAGGDMNRWVTSPEEPRYKHLLVCVRVALEALGRFTFIRGVGSDAPLGLQFPRVFSWGTTF